jgi:putative RecB family exonuclease
MFEGLYISVSQVKTYLKCPRQYELKYVRGLEPAFVPVALAFGIAIHAALAHFYRTIKTTGAPPSLEEVQSVFADCWAAARDGHVPLQVEGDDDASDLREKGERMLAVFYAESMKAPVPNVLAVEEKFSVPLYDPVSGELLEEKLVGFFDLLVQDDEALTIWEHKTAARSWTQDQLRYDLQVTAYILAAKTLGLGEARVRLQILTKTKVPALVIEELHRGERDERDLLVTVASVLKSIDVGAFHPVRSWACKTCTYAGPCGGT